MWRWGGCYPFLTEVLLATHIKLDIIGGALRPTVADVLCGGRWA